MKRLFLAIALLLAAIPAAKPASAQGIWVEGGNTDCGIWHKARQAGQATIFEAFLMGTINGMAVGRDVEFWHATGQHLSREQVFLWLDGYCQRNPLSSITVGAAELLNEHTQGAYDRAWRRLKGLGQ